MFVTLLLRLKYIYMKQSCLCLNSQNHVGAVAELVACLLLLQVV